MAGLHWGMPYMVHGAAVQIDNGQRAAGMSLGSFLHHCTLQPLEYEVEGRR